MIEFTNNLTVFTSFVDQGGNLFIQSGAVLNIVPCSKVDVTFRKETRPTQEIPVVYEGKNMFVNPVR